MNTCLSEIKEKLILFSAVYQMLLNHYHINRYLKVMKIYELNLGPSNLYHHKQNIAKCDIVLSGVYCIKVLTCILESLTVVCHQQLCESCQIVHYHKGTIPGIELHSVMPETKEKRTLVKTIAFIRLLKTTLALWCNSDFKLNHILYVYFYRI